MKKIFLSVTFFCLTVFGAGTSSFISIDLPHGARVIGMGESFTGYDRDTYSQLWNPAGVYGGLSFSASHTMLFEDIKNDFIILTFPTNIGYWGMSLSYIDFGTFNGLDGHARNPYEFTANELIFSIVYGRWVQEHLKFGVGINYGSSRLENENSSVWSINSGLIYTMNRNTKLGLSIKNIGGKLTYIRTPYPLPIALSLGISKKTRNLLYTGEVSLRNDDKPQIGFGLEYKITFLSFRTGFRTQDDLGILSLFRFGFGVEKDWIKFDYAFIPSGDFGLRQYFTLSISR